MGSASPNGLAMVLPNAGGAFAVQTSEIANNAIDNTLMSPSILQTITLTLTAAQMKALHTTPKTVIPAVAGQTAVVLGVMYTLNFGTTQFTSGGTVTLQYHSGAVAITTGIANAFFQGGATARTTDSIIPALAVQNNAVEVVAASANFASGDSTVTITVQYFLTPN